MKKNYIKKAMQIIITYGVCIATSTAIEPSNPNLNQSQNFENCLDFLPGRLDQNLMLAPAKTSKQTTKTYILPATPATTQWGYFDNKQPPVLKIKPGDSVVIETDAASNNQVVPGVSVDQVKK